MTWYFLGDFLGFPTVIPIPFTPEYPPGLQGEAGHFIGGRVRSRILELKKGAMLF